PPVRVLQPHGAMGEPDQVAQQQQRAPDPESSHPVDGAIGQQERGQAEDKDEGRPQIEGDVEEEGAEEGHQLPPCAVLAAWPWMAMRSSAIRYLSYSVMSRFAVPGERHQPWRLRRSGNTGWATISMCGMALRNSSRLRGMW